MLLERCGKFGNCFIDKMQVATGIPGQKDRVVFEVSRYNGGWSSLIGSFSTLEEAKKEAEKH